MTGENAANDGRHAVLYVRSVSPSGACSRQRAVVNRLARLDAVDALADYRVELLGGRLAAPDRDRTGLGREVAATVDAFQAWAESEGRSLESAFRREAVDSTLTGEQYEQVVFPVMTLVEYADPAADEIAFLSPSGDGSSVCTVPDRLDELEANSPLARSAEADDERPTGIER